ncbi:MAG: FHA domain-containing protein [Deltaproteobacteria bacterium]|nr:FHA domain-containing protein [Deltaproteobacteria bacterium]
MTDNSDGVTKVVSRKKSGKENADIPVTIRARLKVARGPDKGKKFELKKSRTVIGRGKQADIQLDDDQASRFHAEISFVNMEFRVKDMHSSNGTFLNGSSVVEYALHNNDKIMIGETLLQLTIELI